MATVSGKPVGILRALVRYLTCWIGPVLFIAGFAALLPSGHERWSLPLLASNYAWALIDRDGRFLQDRIAGTRLVRANR